LEDSVESKRNENILDSIYHDLKKEEHARKKEIKLNAVKFPSIRQPKLKQITVDRPKIKGRRPPTMYHQKLTDDTNAKEPTKEATKETKDTKEHKESKEITKDAKLKGPENKPPKAPKMEKEKEKPSKTPIPNTKKKPAAKQEESSESYEESSEESEESEDDKVTPAPPAAPTAQHEADQKRQELLLHKRKVFQACKEVQKLKDEKKRIK